MDAVEEEALARAFDHLERKWRPELRGRRIPKRVRQAMLASPRFRALVAQARGGGGITDDDPLLVPRVTRALDGSVTDRLLDDLAGMDPGPHFCPDCEGEKHPTERRCRRCQEDARKGRR